MMDLKLLLILCLLDGIIFLTDRKGMCAGSSYIHHSGKVSASHKKMSTYFREKSKEEKMMGSTYIDANKVKGPWLSGEKNKTVRAGRRFEPPPIPGSDSPDYSPNSMDKDGPPLFSREDVIIWGRRWSQPSPSLGPLLSSTEDVMIWGGRWREPPPSPGSISLDYLQSSMEKDGQTSGSGYIPNLETSDTEKEGKNAKSVIIPQITKDYLTGHLLTKLVPSMYTLVICVALPLNLTAIIIFIFRVKVMKPAVVYMLNLAIADVLFVISLPFIITYRFSGNNWLLGEGMCRIVTAAFYCNMYCSILLMTSISVDRFLAVVYPIRSLHWRTTTRAWVVCIFVWILSISGNVPLFLTRQTYFIGNLNTTTCHDVQSMELCNFHLYYDTTFISIFFFLPLLVTTFCYICVIRKLSSLGSESKLKKLRAVVLTVTVLCVFVICFGPTNIIFIIHTFGYYDLENGFLYFAYVICACISSISCCIDPLIYYYGSFKCKEHLHSLLCCKMNSGSEGSTLLALTK